MLGPRNVRCIENKLRMNCPAPSQHTDTHNVYPILPATNLCRCVSPLLTPLLTPLLRYVLDTCNAIPGADVQEFVNKRDPVEAEKRLLRAWAKLVRDSDCDIITVRSTASSV